MRANFHTKPEDSTTEWRNIGSRGMRVFAPPEDSTTEWCNIDSRGLRVFAPPEDSTTEWCNIGSRGLRVFAPPTVLCARQPHPGGVQHNGFLQRFRIKYSYCALPTTKCFSAFYKVGGACSSPDAWQEKAQRQDNAKRFDLPQFFHRGSCKLPPLWRAAETAANTAADTAAKQENSPDLWQSPDPATKSNTLTSTI